MANVKLILIEDVESLGLAGTEVSVAPGFARNYLLPQGKAVPVTKAALRIFEARKEKIEAKRQQAISEAQSMAERIAAAEIIISMEATADDSLFGSVTSRVISDALAAKEITLHPSRINLLDPLKKLGTFEVPVSLNNGVETVVKVQITKA